MNPIASHLIVFLAGIAGGAAATYYGELFGDRRRAKEAKREAVERFEKTRAQMPDLFREMFEDLSSEKNRATRRFFVINKGAILSTDGPALVYYPEAHPNIMGKIAILENRGFITDITPGNAPLYRLSEEFVELLLEMNIPNHPPQPTTDSSAVSRG